MSGSRQQRAVWLKKAVGEPIDGGFGVAGLLGPAGEDLELEFGIFGADDEGEAGSGFLRAAGRQ